MNTYLLLTLTMFPYDQTHSMEKSPEFRICRTLIIDELYFDSFHGSNREDSFTHPSAEASQKSPLWIELAVSIHQSLLYRFKSTKSHCRLWYGAIEQNRQASVQAEEPASLDSLSHTISYARIFFASTSLSIQLQLCLYILRRICDANFYASSDTTCESPLRVLC